MVGERYKYGGAKLPFAIKQRACRNVVQPRPITGMGRNLSHKGLRYLPSHWLCLVHWVEQTLAPKPDYTCPTRNIWTAQSLVTRHTPVQWASAGKVSAGTCGGSGKIIQPIKCVMYASLPPKVNVTKNSKLLKWEASVIVSSCQRTVTVFLTRMTWIMNDELGRNNKLKSTATQ